MKIVHMTVYASDIEKSISFYQKAAGFTIVREKRNGEKRVVFLNDGSQDFCLELVKGNEDMHFEGKYISIGIECADLEAERSRLGALGFAPVEIISPRPDVRFFFISDPDGFQVQFIEK